MEWEKTQLSVASVDTQRAGKSPRPRIAPPAAFVGLRSVHAVKMTKMDLL
jgi:hypothetical protein